MVPEVHGVFKFDKDTRRTHRFTIVTEGGHIEVTGSLYITKDGPGIPKRIVLEYDNQKGTE